MGVQTGKKKTVRRGAILVIVLLGLLVSSMLGLGLIKTVLIHHRQTTVTGGQEQAVRLAEAGIQRAVRRISKSAEYEGETWKVSADVLGSLRTAEVVIEVENADQESDERVIQVQVNLDAGRLQPIGCHRQYAWTLPESESQ